MRRAWLIFNPVAGRYPPTPFVKRAAAVLRERGWQVRLIPTRNGEAITRMARRAARRGVEAVFVAGGDGSVGLAAAGLMGTSTALGILPAGTANVFAQDLGLARMSWTHWRGLEESARVLADAPAYWADMGRCNGHPFLLWAGTGLDAVVVQKVEPRRRWEKVFGIAKYATHAVWTASTWSGMRLQVEVDDFRSEGEFIMAVATNIPRFAGGLTQLAPHARLDDGQMDLWLFRGHAFNDIARIAWKLWLGRLDDIPGAVHLTFHKARIMGQGHLPFQLDGEPLLCAPDVTLEVIPRAVRLLVPPDARHLFSHSSAVALTPASPASRQAPPLDFS